MFKYASVQYQDMAIIDAAEQLVRIRLEEREKKRISEYIERHPELEGEMETLFSEFDRSLRESLKTTGLAMIESEKKEIDGKIGKLTQHVPYKNRVLELEVYNKKRELVLRMLALDEDAENIDKDVDELVKGPPLNQLAGFFSLDTVRATAGDEYKASLSKKFEEAEAELTRTMPAELGDSGKKVLGEIKKSAEYSRLDDVLVSRLTEIANKEGIEYALKEETIAGVTKWMFPTPELYRKHKETKNGLMVNALAQTYAVFDVLGAAAKDEGERASWKLVGTILSKGINSYSSIRTKIQDGLDEQDVKSIYGAASPAEKLETERANIVGKYVRANNSAGK